MIYLTGITKAEYNSSKKKSINFKVLKIPFKTDKEVYKFMNSRQRKFKMAVYLKTKEI